MRLRLAAVLTLAVLLSTAAAAVTLASSQPRAARATFDPRWLVISHNGEATDGPYTLLTSTSPREAGTVIDERTGRRIRVLLPPDCRTPVESNMFLGDSWLLADCSHTRLALYSLAGRHWRSVTIASSCQHFNGGPGGSCLPLAVGTNWISYDEANYHLGDRFIFQNIATGAVRRDPGNARTLADLDSPVLARRICDPLRVPSYGTLAFDGRYAVATDPQGIFLEHCGTRLHLLLSYGPWVAMAPGAIVWLPAPNRALRGIFLPSLRRFSVAPPRGAADMVNVDLSDRHIYIIGTTRNNTNDVWSAAAPVLQTPQTQ
jgi:hypothetical protein